MNSDVPKMVVAALLAFIVIIGILSGYNPLEFFLPTDEDRTPGTWLSAPLGTPKNDEMIEGKPRVFPESEPKDIELE